MADKEGPLKSLVKTSAVEHCQHFGGSDPRVERCRHCAAQSCTLVRESRSGTSRRFHSQAWVRRVRALVVTTTQTADRPEVP